MKLAYKSSGESSGSSGVAKKPSESAPTSLLQSAELLAGLILDSPQKQSSVDASNSDLQPSINNSAEKGGESVNEDTIFPAGAPAALNQLVLFHHLPDLCAAFIQLAVLGRDPPGFY
jgi:hypothetical protein